MEEQRFSSSHDNPAATGDRRPQPAASVPSITERFHAMLRERQEELREATGEDSPPPPSAGDIVRCYKEVLSELIFNSKPIITELTMIAGQQILYSKEIADVICSRVLEVPGEQKLPSLYLIDSIVKNIGREYVKIFATRIPKVFCIAYNQVDPALYPSMRHLFRTWSQVFPSIVLQKIEDELEFSPSEGQRPSMAVSNRLSKSPSPHPSHGIHVNPMYLEAQRQQSSKVIPHERFSSTSQVRANKQTAQYSEYDMDQPELLSQSFDTAGAGSPRRKRMCLTPMTGTSESVSYPKHQLAIQSSPPRIDLRRPVLPLNERSLDDSSTTTLGRASRSHPASAYAPGRVSGANSWLDQNRLPNEDLQHVEISTLYNLNNGFSKKHPRDLIDAYGNPRRSHEKLPKALRLDVNSIATEEASKEWKNSDEEEYVWEDMSPTLADRSRKNSVSPFGPSAGSYSIRTNLSRPNPALLESDFVRHSWPGQAQLRTVDDPPRVVEDRIAAFGSQTGLMKRSLDGTAIQSESVSQLQNSNHTGKFMYMLPQSTHHNLSPRSRNRTSQMSMSVRGMAPVIGQRLPVLEDNSTDMELPHRRSSNACAEPLRMETSLTDSYSTQRRSSVPARLPPAHVSQSLTLRTVPLTQSQISTLDASETNKLIQGRCIFVPEQQYDVADRKNSDSVKLHHLPYQPSVLSQHGMEQGIPLPLPSLQTYQSLLPPGQTQVSSYSVGQLQNLQPTLGHGVAIPALASSLATPAAVQSTTDTSSHVHARLLPPLPPGPPPSTHTSQSTSSSVSGFPASAFSGLINSLMAQGLISLNPNSQAQDSFGVEFNVELLKVRRESAINSLYSDLPRQCTTCGLRFKCQEDHRSHMDWHVTKNRISKNRKQKPSRKWFVSAKEWLSGAETVGNDVPRFLPTESVAEKKEDTEMAVPADEHQNVCALCGETFEDFYSDETEEWMYKGAVYLNAPDGYTEGLDRSQLGPIVHAKCRSESNESRQANGHGK